MPKLALYHYAGCYFCRLVEEALQAFGMEAERRDIREDRRWREDLIRLDGRTTVPVLRIEDMEGKVTWMRESQQIVRYLEGLQSRAEGSGAD